MALDSKWKQTVDDALTNPDWDAYDKLIQSEVSDYNQRLRLTTGFVVLGWKIFKAVAWAETGAKNPEWKTRPMQIGNIGDPGYTALKNGNEATLLIMSEKLTKDVKTGDINNPELNIQSGIAYALNRLVRSDIKSVDDVKDKTLHTYSVASGDNLTVIAKKVGSTVESLKALNPTALVLKPHQVLKYRKASMQRVITGWTLVTTAAIASTYNTGDVDYKAKLDYALTVIDKIKR